MIASASVNSRGKVPILLSIYIEIMKRKIQIGKLSESGSVITFERNTKWGWIYNLFLLRLLAGAIEAV